MAHESLKQALEALQADVAETKAILASKERAVEELQKILGPVSNFSLGLDLKDMTVTEAAEAVLRHVGKPLGSLEIADAIVSGGKQVKLENRAGSIYQMLRNAKERFRYREGQWGMKEWKDEMWGGKRR